MVSCEARRIGSLPWKRMVVARGPKPHCLGPPNFGQNEVNMQSLSRTRTRRVMRAVHFVYKLTGSLLNLFQTSSSYHTYPT